MNQLKRLKCKKEFEKKHNTHFFYVKVMPNVYNDLDAPLYELYNSEDENINSKKTLLYNFATYGDMKYYVETGKVI